MTTRPAPRAERALSRIVGTLLIFAGLTFVAFVVGLAMSDSRKLPGHLTGVLFMLGSGTLLVWAGWSFLRPEREDGGNVGQWPRFGAPAAGRPVVELLAMSGCGLMLAHAVALSTGSSWPPAPLLLVLVTAPVGTGLLTLWILVPGAFRSGLFANDVWGRWHRGAHLVVKTVLTVGWAGYLAIPLAVLDLYADALSPWYPGAQILVSSLISVLYASQVLALHYGRLRGQAG